MKILVTGGAGYIGSHVAKDLLDQGHEVLIYENLSTGHHINIDKRAKLVVDDILEKDALLDALKGIEMVFHFAALKAPGDSMKEPEKYSDVNIVGTITLLNAMIESNIKYIVFSSSCSTYGTPKYLPVDEKHPQVPESYYGFTKLTIEKILEWYSLLKGIKYASLRYFNAAGYDASGAIKGKDRQPTNLLPIVFEAVAGQRKFVEVFGTDYDTPDGSCIRDYLHVTDLSDAHIKAMQYIQTKGNIAVNLGTGKGTSVLEIINKVKQATGKDFEVKLSPRRWGDPSKIVASCVLAKELLGWEAKHSDMDNIVKTTWAVYQG